MSFPWMAVIWARRDWSLGAPFISAPLKRDSSTTHIFKRENHFFTALAISLSFACTNFSKRTTANRIASRWRHSSPVTS